MMPIGLLMIEHRLIERFIMLVKDEEQKIRRTKKANISFLDTAVDFFKTYADRCHHGKEEDILFRGLAKKKLSDLDATTMKGLLEDHVYARKVVGRLAKAKNTYDQGQEGALKDLRDCLNELSTLYPKHIVKEDKHFFIPSMNYFSKQEQDTMLKEFWEFDRNLIHEKYQKIVEGFEDR